MTVTSDGAANRLGDAQVGEVLALSSAELLAGSQAGSGGWPAVGPG